jgi:hypothetical protein
MGTARHENVAIFQGKMSGKESNEIKLLSFFASKIFQGALSD